MLSWLVDTIFILYKKKIYDVWMYILYFGMKKIICTSRMYMDCSLYFEDDFVPLFDRLRVCLCCENNSCMAMSS